MIELRDVRAGYGGEDVLRGISLTFPLGKVLALLGPNGCGKSTLLRTVIGLQAKSGGEILIDGTPAERLSARQRAQKVAYLPQSRNVPNITAYRMVLHGRFPYLSYPRRCRPEDHEAVRRALAWVQAEDIAHCPMQELSGGQRQRIYLAMALAQDTQTLLMDEPTTYLDVRHQIEVVKTARRLAATGRAVALVLHDLCLAMRTADQVAVLSGGRLVANGPPEEIYGTGILDETFGISLRRFQAENGAQYYYG